MKTRSRILVQLSIAVVSLMLFTGGWVAPSAQERNPAAGGDLRGIARVSRPIERRWSARQDLDAFYPAQVARVDVTTPTGVNRVDITVTLSFDHKVSVGDQAFIHVAIFDGTPPADPLAPAGGYTISASPEGLKTSSSLSWLARQIPGDGATYELWVTASALDQSGDLRAVVSGSAGVVTVDMVPSDR